MVTGEREAFGAWAGRERFEKRDQPSHGEDFESRRSRQGVATGLADNEDEIRNILPEVLKVGAPGDSKD